ncbi:MAG: hypothetical protein M0C28_48445, partial [Candidatus Moduliflexus flocculans]|nr:hypothetical protein [Candidatus Moduliflexus flocculans]
KLRIAKVKQTTTNGIDSTSSGRTLAAALILGIGLPSSVGQALSALGFTVLQGVVNLFGTGAIAAFGVGNRLIGLFDLPAHGSVRGDHDDPGRPGPGGPGRGPGGPGCGSALRLCLVLVGLPLAASVAFGGHLRAVIRGRPGGGGRRRPHVQGRGALGPLLLPLPGADRGLPGRRGYPGHHGPVRRPRSGSSGFPWPTPWPSWPGWDPCPSGIAMFGPTWPRPWRDSPGSGAADGGRPCGTAAPGSLHRLRSHQGLPAVVQFHRHPEPAARAAKARLPKNPTWVGSSRYHQIRNSPGSSGAKRVRIARRPPGARVRASRASSKYGRARCSATSWRAIRSKGPAWAVRSGAK